MCREVYKTIAKRQVEGLMFHSDMADYYGFLNLKPFKDFHDKQYIAESKMLRKIKDHFIEEKHQTLQLGEITIPTDITPIEWESKTTADVDKNTVKILVKQSLEIYHKWETDTYNLYKEQADKLFDWGYFEDYCFVRDIADDVEKEKSHIASLIADLALVDYDITAIKGIQYKIK